MVPERVQRKLAAILSADVVGYSRLVGMDETVSVIKVFETASGAN